MGDHFKKVQAGQSLEISASVWNALIDLTRKDKQSQQDRGDATRPVQAQSNFALVRNQTGFDLDRFTVIELGTPVITPSDNLLEFKNRTTFGGLIPSVSTGGRFGVMTEPLASSLIGTAAVAGVTVVRIATTGTLYACAAPIAGQPFLQNVPHGPASVLWMEESGPLRWAIIRFDQSNCEEIVYITSNIPDDDGFYSAIVQRYSTLTHTWISQYPCKVIDANR